jgi:hypothetical protein
MGKTPSDLRTSYVVPHAKRPLKGEEGYNAKTPATVMGYLDAEAAVPGGSFLFVESQPGKDPNAKMYKFPHILNVWGDEARAFCYKNSLDKSLICHECYFLTRDALRHDIISWRAWANAKAVENGADPFGFSIWPAPNDNLNFCRINSNGEIGNVKECIWFFETILKNPGITFGWWTKRHDLVLKAMKQLKIEKPKNVILIKSSFRINHQDTLPDQFDRVFTVFDEETLEAKVAEGAVQKGSDEKFVAVCDGQQCFGCMLCYTASNKRVFINERIK